MGQFGPGSLSSILQDGPQSVLFEKTITEYLDRVEMEVALKDHPSLSSRSPRRSSWYGSSSAGEERRRILGCKQCWNWI